MLKRNFFRKIFFGLPTDFESDSREMLAKTNYRLLKKSCIFSTFMCLFLFLLTFFNALIADLKFFYLFYTLLFAVLTIAVLVFARRKNFLVAVFFYLFAIAIFALAVEIGTIKSPEIPAVTFYVFLIIIPILRVTRPLYSVLVSIAATAAFCVTTTLVKQGDFLASNDILNAVCVCIVGIGCDLTIVNMQLENHRSKLYFERQSKIDELTSLYNRRQLNLYVDKTFADCLSKGKNFRVLMMDIDDFKHYNDKYGHLTGDTCLVRVSERLHEIAEEENMFLARYGGEEFVAADTGGRPLQDIAERFLQGISDLEIPHEASAFGKITLSIGGAELSKLRCETYMRLLNEADAALYRAKSAGKNGTAFADGEADPSVAGEALL